MALPLQTPINKEGRSPTMPATHYVALTPSDADNVTAPIRSLYIGVSGDVAVGSPADPSTKVTFKSVPIGILSIEVGRLYSTGTTATNIIGLL